MVNLPPIKRKRRNVFMNIKAQSMVNIINVEFDPVDGKGKKSNEMHWPG